jgi:hypothetical protein
MKSGWASPHASGKACSSGVGMEVASRPRSSPRCGCFRRGSCLRAAGSVVGSTPSDATKSPTYCIPYREGLTQVFGDAAVGASLDVPLARDWPSPAGRNTSTLGEPPPISPCPMPLVLKLSTEHTTHAATATPTHAPAPAYAHKRAHTHTRARQARHPARQ